MNRAFISQKLDRAARKRHRFYGQLFVLMLAQMALWALPWKLHRFGVIGTGVMMLLLVVQLGRPMPGPPSNGSHEGRLYRLFGLAGLTGLSIWFLAPNQAGLHGLLVLLALVLFVCWSLLRLLRLLGQEQVVSRSVLVGALAGYLMLCISGGLFLSVLETLQPGSFVDLVSTKQTGLTGNHPLVSLDNRESRQVWEMDFSRINYFAFVSTTTVGYGDIVPVRRFAQLASVSLSIMGPVYIAMVMGLLISRYTVQAQVEEALDEANADQVKEQ